MIVTDIIKPRARDAGTYYSDDAGFVVPRGVSRIAVNLSRADPSWDRDRAGDGRVEHVEIHDRLTQQTLTPLINRDESVRVISMLSRDRGQSWEPLGLVGTRAGRKPKRVGGTLLAPVLGAPADWTRNLSFFRRDEDEDILVRFLVDVRAPIHVAAQFGFVEGPPEILLRPTLHHSVAHEASASSSFSTDATSTGTANLDNTTGTNRLVILEGTAYDVVAVESITGQWNSQGMTGEGQNNVAGLVAGYIGHQTEADGADATTTTGTLSVSTSHDYLIGLSRSLSGVDQTTPADTAVGANGASSTPSVTVTNMAADDMSIDVCAVAAATITPTASQANYLEGENFSDGDSIGTGTLTGTGNVTHSYGSVAAWVIRAQRFLTVQSAGEPVSAWAHPEINIVRSR